MYLFKMKNRGPVMLSRFFLGALLLIIVTGCGLSGFQRGLSAAMMNNPDPATVREAMPTFLVTTDALIEAAPEDVGRLRTGSELYSAFAVLFIDDPERAQRLVARAKFYGEKALCLDDDIACNLDQADFETFVAMLNRLDDDALPSLYAYTLSWLAWARLNSDDWSVVANLPKYQAALAHIVEQNENFRQGSALVYLGMVKSLRPPSLGGKPEEARQHFERAIELSDGRNLAAKVELAQSYARLVYDRQLHDQLLKEVLQAPVEAPGLTLQNALAKNQARDLLQSADEYF
jgi:tetratricopeptide (TPR) repeat protein